MSTKYMTFQLRKQIMKRLYKLRRMSTKYMAFQMRKQIMKRLYKLRRMSTKYMAFQLRKQIMKRLYMQIVKRLYKLRRMSTKYMAFKLRKQIMKRLYMQIVKRLYIEEDVNKVHGFPIEKADNEEIVEVEEVDKKAHDIPIEEENVLKGKKNVYVSLDVKHALETLEKAISMVREYGFPSCRSSSSIDVKHALEKLDNEKGGKVDSCSVKLLQLSSKKEVSVKVSSNNIMEETSEEPRTNSEIQDFRHTRTNPKSKEVNYNKVVPASPEQNLSRPIEASQVDSYSLKNETTMDQTLCDNKQLNIDMSSDVPKLSSRQKKASILLFFALAKSGIYLANL